jgi:hypothetical protein
MDGSIMAAIIVTHNTRNRGSAIPIVPGSTPMSRAWPIVSTQAGTAIRTTRSQATARSRAGSRPPPVPVGATDRSATRAELRL